VSVAAFFHSTAWQAAAARHVLLLLFFKEESCLKNGFFTTCSLVPKRGIFFTLCKLVVRGTVMIFSAWRSSVEL